MAAGKPSLTDVGLLIVRAAGAAMAYHGWKKLNLAFEPGDWAFVDSVRRLGFPQPALFAWAAAISEFVAALAVTLGIYTRVSAFLVAFTMFVAAFMQHGSDPFEKRELALVYFVLFLGLVFSGGGRLTIDTYWRKG